jgi:hypothetical protein
MHTSPSKNRVTALAETFRLEKAEEHSEEYDVYNNPQFMKIGRPAIAHFPGGKESAFGNGTGFHRPGNKVHRTKHKCTVTADRASRDSV